LESFFGTLFKGSNVTLVHSSLSEPRARFTLDVKSASVFDIQTLLDNISTELEPVHA
jgi:hypothetical protein